MKNYIIISDFNIKSNNRGTAALGYGSIAFLSEKGYIEDTDEIISYVFYRNPFRKISNNTVNELDINGRKWKQHIIHVCIFEILLLKYKLLFINTDFKKSIKKMKLVAAINGGDGLTDIYGEYLLNARLREIKLAIDFGIPYILLPQTIGPFMNVNNEKSILRILNGADKIYLRDHNYDNTLINNNIPFENTNDLSFFMNPLDFPIEIHHPSVGINISGLAYSNRFGNLAGQFDCYHRLIEELINNFRNKNINVYIIPHSYNVTNPEINNDDMVSSKEFFGKLSDKTGVFLMDKELISPQVKYLISQMDYFIGTRMHANFAAIFTKTPVFGLAYSYKFEGAFKVNGINNSTYMINNMNEDEIPALIEKINRKFGL